MKKHILIYGFLMGALPVSFFTELSFYFFIDTGFSFQRFSFLLFFNSLYWILISYFQWKHKES